MDNNTYIAYHMNLENTHMKAFFRIVLKIFELLLKTAACVLCIGMIVVLLAYFTLGRGTVVKEGAQIPSVDYAIMDRYNNFINNTLSDALDGVLSIKKVYWLSDDDLVAPEPDQERFGTAKDPAELQWLLDAAAGVLDGQETLFNTQTPVWDKSEIHYYLDDTIFTVTWKQPIGGSMYTISEVKIADPSQFRRFLADGEYASSAKYTAVEMASSVNAVVAANGDFYTFRNLGIIVYDSQLMRMEGREMDTCFIAGNGDLLFAHKGQIVSQEETEAFLKENGVRFSISFGPILIENGEKCWIKNPYPVGEGNIRDARAALCQLDSLHYLLIAVNQDGEYKNRHNLKELQENLYNMGCKQAYNLDGGQSATIVVNDKKINEVWLRKISDIIYFATALPSEG